MMKQYAISAKTRAMEALEALLTHTSTIRLKDIDMEMVGGSSEADIVAHVEALGRSHTLACQLVGDGAPQHVREALEKSRHSIGQIPGDVTPLIVVPCLTEEVRELCRESNAGFLDLYGNGCLVFGEVFISKRSLPCRDLYGSTAASKRAVEAKASRNRPEKFPPAKANLPSRGFEIMKHAQGR